MTKTISKEEARAVAKNICKDIKPYIDQQMERYMTFLAEHYVDEYTRLIANGKEEIEDE